MATAKSAYRSSLDPCEAIDLEGMPPPRHAFRRAYRRYAPDLAVLSRLITMTGWFIPVVLVVAFLNGGVALALVGIWILIVGVTFYFHLPKPNELAKQASAARPYEALSPKLLKQLADGDPNLTQYCNRLDQQGRPPFRCEIEAARSWRKAAKRGSVSK